MVRKHPVSHIVKGHRKSDGTYVRTYHRGKGTKPARRLTPETLTGPKAYTVNFVYSNKKGDGESVIVIASSYDNALEEAYEERVSNRSPIAVDIIDPSIGSVLSFIGNTAKEALSRGVQAIRQHGVPALKLGAKYAVKGGSVAFTAAKKVGKAAVVAGKETIKQSAIEYVGKVEQENVKKLIKAAYSSNVAVKNAARSTLKNYYPEVYDIMDFSEPSFERMKGLKKIAREARIEQRAIIPRAGF